MLLEGMVGIGHEHRERIGKDRACLVERDAVFPLVVASLGCIPLELVAHGHTVRLSDTVSNCFAADRIIPDDPRFQVRIPFSEDAVRPITVYGYALGTAPLTWMQAGRIDLKSSVGSGTSNRLRA